MTTYKQRSRELGEQQARHRAETARRQHATAQREALELEAIRGEQARLRAAYYARRAERPTR